MDIIKAEITDAQEILDLQKFAYHSEAEIYKDFTIQPLQQTLSEITLEIKTQCVLKYVQDNKIIGSVRAYTENETCFINKLIVHPDFQNKGIGKKLLHEIESRFSSAKRFELFTGHKSMKNIYLYGKHGYKIFRNEKINDSLTIIFLEKSREPEKC